MSVAPEAAAVVPAMSATSLEENVANRLAIGVMRLSRRLRQRSAGGITASQYAALVTISKRDELTLGELAAAEGVAPPSMTRIAANLEQAGLVERRPDPLDRRVARVAISEKGVELLAAARSLRALYLSERLGELDPEEVEVLDRAAELLSRLACDPQ
jgi:DNA-binding MarR family transcriptional regulator